MIDTLAFYNTLLENGLDYFTGVPDSLLSQFCNCVFANAPGDRNIIAANEGGAVGIACGYHMASGKAAVVYMQNSGEGNAVNPLLSIADPDVYSIPMLLLIGWRGEPGVHDEPQHVKQGKVTLALLDTMGIPFEIADDTWMEQLTRLTTIMREESRPVALVIRKGMFSAYPFPKMGEKYELTREAALEAIISNLGDDDIVVSTTGKTSREVFEIRERRGEGHDRDFLTVGGMGHTSSIAFGLASATNRNVWCLDGDGSLIMHMGSLAVIAQNAGANFKYIVNVNGAHESVGGQPNVARSIDIPAILYALGFSDVYEAGSSDGIADALAKMRASRLAALVLTTRQGSRDDLGRPTTTPQENKAALMALLKAGK